MWMDRAAEFGGETLAQAASVRLKASVSGPAMRCDMVIAPLWPVFKSAVLQA